MGLNPTPQSYHSSQSHYSHGTMPPYHVVCKYPWMPQDSILCGLDKSCNPVTQRQREKMQ